MNTMGLLFAQEAEQIGQVSEQAGGLMGQWGGFLPIILMIVVFYLLLIRPQQKKEKDRRKMIAALQNGDKVLTAGGIYGVVSSIKNDDIIVLKISDSSKVEVARSAIQAKVTN